MYWLIDAITTYFVGLIRPLIKWVLHELTRLNELQRLCYGADAGANRTRQVERALMLSRSPDIRVVCAQSDELVKQRGCSDETLVEIARCIEKVVSIVKRIDERAHPDFGALLRDTLTAIWSYRRLAYDVEHLRSEPYDANNAEHERRLLRLYELLRPDHPLRSRVSKQWQDLGFQGDDPKTDFRGMGMLGLENLLYLATTYTDAARHNLQHSLHIAHGYTFAIVGINLTALCYRLVRTTQARTHFFNVAHSHRHKYITMQDFHEFYCCLFLEFDRYWLYSRPRDLMDFRDIYQRFEIRVIEELLKDETHFKMNLVVDHL